MNYGLIYGIYAAIIVAAVAVTSCIKILVKKYSGGTVSTLWEYLLSCISFVLAAGCNFLWLYFFGGFTSVPYYVVMLLLAGSSTYIIYLLLFQSTRKAGLALIKRITSRITGTEFTEAIASTAKNGETDEETAKKVADTLTNSDSDVLDKVYAVIQSSQTDSNDKT